MRQGGGNHSGILKSRNLYGGINAAVCFLIVFCGTGAAALTFNMFTIPVTDHYQISRTSYSFTISLASVISALCYFGYGPSVKRIGVKRSIVIGLAMYGIGLGLFASGWGVWTLYAKAVLCGIAGVYISSSALIQIINNWFAERRGLIIGLICAASGIGGSVFSPILGIIQENAGWQVTCLILCALVLGCVPVAWIFLSVHPRDRDMDYSEESGSMDAGNGMSVGQVLKDWRFWLFSAGVFCIHFSMTPSYNNVTPHLIDSGFSPMWVMGIAMAVLLISNAAAKPLMGILNDRLGVLSTVIVTCGLSTLAPMMMSCADRSGKGFTIAAVILLGLGTPVTTVVIPLIVSRIFGNREYNTIIGFLMATGYLGTTLGTPISNYLFDRVGTYQVSYYLCAAMAAVTLILLTAILTVKVRPEQSAPQKKPESAIQST